MSSSPWRALRSSLSFRGSGGAYNRGLADTVGYGDSSNGRKLTEAFIIAFNQLVDQRAALTAAPAVASTPAAGPQESAAVVAVDTVMRAAPNAASDTTAELLRKLRREILLDFVAESFSMTWPFHTNG